MEIDLDKEAFEKNKKYLKDKQIDDYDNFYKKESYIFDKLIYLIEYDL